jgi:fluoroquinolone resistance protein
VTFDADLTISNLDQARLKGADLRCATVDGVDLGTPDLHEVRLDLMQAVAVARSLGAFVDFDG